MRDVVELEPDDEAFDVPDHWIGEVQPFAKVLWLELMEAEGVCHPRIKKNVCLERVEAVHDLDSFAMNLFRDAEKRR